ncbi:hypothetical protein O0I10_005339 [Lichtheimia ornata]|uniref:Uncharacterized protein n=1 Tax=Lichtheimia ornata TaxID=688661 RepID=A0AAD7Y1P7_9FUNG|nr:uncharacterized protein O0I10_005339 [Lichtheimia ornata]KAJ8658957.1 hypothetical protein O0I10_005339 [Lichtheimia ornata]
MTKSLDGKVAVLTGASRNIGKAVAVELVSRGAKVVIGDILDKQGEETVQELNNSAGSKVAAYIHTDVTKYDDNVALFKLAEKEFGGVDIAFLNAGIGTNANTMFMPLDDKLDERMLDINTTAVVKGTKVAMLHMAKRGGGAIVNTASVAGFLASPSVGIYAASKHGVVGWTRSCGIFKEVCNVRVNALCPYWVSTDLKTDLANKTNNDPFDTMVSSAPTTDMETVVEAVLRMIEDESLNSTTLLALPGNVIRAQEPIPPYPEILSEEYLSTVKKYQAESIAFYKQQLADALKRYGI